MKKLQIKNKKVKLAKLRVVEDAAYDMRRFYNKISYVEQPEKELDAYERFKAEKDRIKL